MTSRGMPLFSVDVAQLAGSNPTIRVPTSGQLLASSTFVASKQAMDNARFYILAIPRASRIWSFHPIGDTKVSELSLLLNIEMSAEISHPCQR